MWLKFKEFEWLEIVFAPTDDDEATMYVFCQGIYSFTGNVLEVLTSGQTKAEAPRMPIKVDGDITEIWRHGEGVNHAKRKMIINVREIWNEPTTMEDEEGNTIWKHLDGTIWKFSKDDRMEITPDDQDDDQEIIPDDRPDAW